MLSRAQLIDEILQELQKRDNHEAEAEINDEESIDENAVSDGFDNDEDNDNDDSFHLNKLSAERDTNRIQEQDITQNWRDKIRRKSALVMGGLRDKFQMEREYCNW